LFLWKATMNPRSPIHQEEIIHPSLKVSHIRELDWWPARQIMLEDEAAAGKRTLNHGTFYVFLEETHQDHHRCFWKGKPRTQAYIARYGHVYRTDHWAIRAVALPLGHPDRDIEPYQMEFVEEWRKTMGLKIETDKKE